MTSPVYQEDAGNASEYIPLYAAFPTASTRERIRQYVYGFQYKPYGCYSTNAEIADKLGKFTRNERNKISETVRDMIKDGELIEREVDPFRKGKIRGLLVRVDQASVELWKSGRNAKTACKTPLEETYESIPENTSDEAYATTEATKPTRRAKKATAAREKYKKPTVAVTTPTLVEVPATAQEENGTEAVTAQEEAETVGVSEEEVDDACKTAAEYLEENREKWIPQAENSAILLVDGEHQALVLAHHVLKSGHGRELLARTLEGGDDEALYSYLLEGASLAAKHVTVSAAAFKTGWRPKKPWTLFNNTPQSLNDK